MPSQTIQGIVLRFANYRDHDRMLTLLSPEHGRMDVLARGCRRPKSMLLPASQPFVKGEFVLYRNKDRYSLTSCHIDDTFYPLRLDPYRLTCASYLLGLCQVAAQPNEEARNLYALLLEGLYCLTYQKNTSPLNLTNSFLLLYAGVIGYKPRMNHCAHCRTSLNLSNGAYLDVEAGGLVCTSCKGKVSYHLSHEQIQWMQNVLLKGLAFSATPSNDDQEMDLQTKTTAPDLFLILRRYVESRLDTVIKVSKLLP